MPDPTAAAGPHPHKAPKETVQDILISIVIAFALAFVFRGFVIEAFVIPTGSMAPTLMGQHQQFHSPQNGYTWPVGPRMKMEGGNAIAQMPPQNSWVHDPMSGAALSADRQPMRAGDRILVLKYLYLLFSPERFDVVVFKSPVKPETNFIKRLIGLPGEEIALVDGDVFVRKAAAGDGAVDVPDGGAWSLLGWKIQRKPRLVQEAVWQAVFDSSYAPLNPVSNGMRWYNPPWTPRAPGTSGSAIAPSQGAAIDWRLDGPVYEYASSSPTELAWDAVKVRYVTMQVRVPWTIDDSYPYNEISNPRSPTFDPRFPDPLSVSDVRLAANVQPEKEGLRLAATLVSRGREFEWSMEKDRAVIRMRPEGGDATAWTVMDEGKMTPLPVGRATPVEFWHVDQELSVYVDGKLVAGGPGKADYDWNPAERVQAAMGRSVKEMLEIEPSLRGTSVFGWGEYADQRTGVRVQNYRHGRLWWSLSGSPVKMYSVRVDRDLHYQANNNRPESRTGHWLPARGTHPGLGNRMILKPGQYFVCGDNSPASDDARTWDAPDPWVGLIDPDAGVVPKELMLGKAFFVYFPALNSRGPVAVPDFGRMRFIW